MSPALACEYILVDAREKRDERENGVYWMENKYVARRFSTRARVINI